MAETKYEARLKTLYNESVAKELKDEVTQVEETSDKGEE